MKIGKGFNDGWVQSREKGSPTSSTNLTPSSVHGKANYKVPYVSFKQAGSILIENAGPENLQKVMIKKQKKQPIFRRQF